MGGSDYVRGYFLKSFGYFSQPDHRRADYGYRGDWAPDKITLRVSAVRHKDMQPNEILDVQTASGMWWKKWCVPSRRLSPSAPQKNTFSRTTYRDFFDLNNVGAEIGSAYSADARNDVETHIAGEPFRLFFINSENEIGKTTSYRHIQ